MNPVVNGMNPVKPLPRGIRNNNPGNIRNNPNNKWQGLVGRDGEAINSMCKFDTPESGIRALARIIGNDLLFGKTLRATISEWAPSSENDTGAYVRAVSSQTGLPADLVFNKAYIMAHLPDVINAIIDHENGRLIQFFPKVQVVNAPWFERSVLITACKSAFPQYSFQ